MTPHGTRVVLSPVRSHSVTSVLVPLWLGKGLWGVRVSHQPRGPQTFLFLCACGHLGTWPSPWFHLCLFGLQRIEWVGTEGQESARKARWAWDVEAWGGEKGWGAGGHAGEGGAGQGSWGERARGRQSSVVRIPWVPFNSI